VPTLMPEKIPELYLPYIRWLPLPSIRPPPHIQPPLTSAPPCPSPPNLEGKYSPPASFGSGLSMPSSSP
jgi:hypothetical protein